MSEDGQVLPDALLEEAQDQAFGQRRVDPGRDGPRGERGGEPAGLGDGPGAASHGLEPRPVSRRHVTQGQIRSFRGTPLAMAGFASRMAPSSTPLMRSALMSLVSGAFSVGVDQ